MVKAIFLVIAVLLIIFVILVTMQPEEFRVTRSVTISAPVNAVFSWVNDLHKWESWSPWAKLDPNAETSFEGAASGVGAVMRWSGNKNVGAGSMTITETRPDELIRLQLEFLKPMKGISAVEFNFLPDGDKTTVTWNMHGKNNFISKAIGLVFNCEKIVGKQYEEGLANLKAVVESRKDKD